MNARLALGLVAAGLLAGCAGQRLATRPYAPPSPDELLAAVRARQEAIAGMNAEARATSWLGGERVRGTVQMLVARGGQLRFEAEVALQGTVAALAVDHGHFTFIDHNKHLFRAGPACPANVASLLRIPLAPAEVAAILLGDAPLPENPSAAQVAWDGAAAADVLVLPGPGGATFWLGLRRPNPAVAAWDVVYLEGQAPASREPLARGLRRSRARRPGRAAAPDPFRRAGQGLGRRRRDQDPRARPEPRLPRRRLHPRRAPGLHRRASPLPSNPGPR